MHTLVYYVCWKHIAQYVNDIYSPPSQFLDSGSYHPYCTLPGIIYTNNFLPVKHADSLGYIIMSFTYY